VVALAAMAAARHIGLICMMSSCQAGAALRRLHIVPGESNALLTAT
jgi:hypothetical protein